jgi:hypothetical protein
MRKYLIIISAILFLTACSRVDNQNIIKINGKEIKVEIADTPAERYKGLSGRENLCGDCGMLFKFDDKRERAFVMREMNFPLDIIWINDEKIVKIDKGLPPKGHNPVNLYKSDTAVNYVLEVNAGFVDKYGIKAGDKVIVK